MSCVALQGLTCPQSFIMGIPFFISAALQVSCKQLPGCIARVSHLILAPKLRAVLPCIVCVSKATCLQQNGCMSVAWRLMCVPKWVTSHHCTSHAWRTTCLYSKILNTHPHGDGHWSTPGDGLLDFPFPQAGDGLLGPPFITLWPTTICTKADQCETCQNTFQLICNLSFSMPIEK